MKFNFQKKASKGFSLIELIVAVSVIVIISSVALFHQAKFSSDILISNVAYEIALAIRQAQVYGISSKGNPAAATYQYRVGYGVHFEASGTKPDLFLSFVDVPPGQAATPGVDTIFEYTYDAIDPTPATIELTQGQKIHRFCGHSTTSDIWECWGISPPDYQTMSLDIVFVKPNPDAHITIDYGDGPSSAYDQAKIVIESGLGDKCRTVRIWTTGQISVDAIKSANPAGCELLPDENE